MCDIMKVSLLLIFLCAVSNNVTVADDIGDIVDELFEGYPEYRGLRDILLGGSIDDDSLKKAYFVENWISLGVAICNRRWV